MKNEEEINPAFFNVNQEISYLYKQINFLKLGLSDLKNELKLVAEFMKDVQKELKNSKNTQKTQISTQNQENPAFRQITSTYSTDGLPLEALRTPNASISIGNGGVSTDRQTNRQTDKYAKNELKIMQKTSKYNENPQNLLKIASGVYFKEQKLSEKPKPNHLEKASEIIENLDSLKKELRFKFKNLTSQEFKVFSAIYQLNNEKKPTNYTLLSHKLSISESSIRDYISRIIAKGVPLIKKKINNKQVLVSIQPELEKIASLAAIIQLRES